MTRNYYHDGPPPAGRSWAQAGRSPQGVFGIVIGCGSLQIGFVPEGDLVSYIATGRQIGEDLDLLQLVIDAAQDLAKFKSEHGRRMAQGLAAKFN